MLHDVKSVFAKPAFLTEINGKRAVADNCVQRCTETFDIKAVSGDCLPRELTTGAEPADIAYEAEFLCRARFDA